MRSFFVYVLASKSRRIYVGVTNNLPRRLAQHRLKLSGFTSRYRINRLVYFEVTENPFSAIGREKEMKGWVRRKKIALIEASNPTWRDLAEGWFDNPLLFATADPSRRQRRRSG